MTHPKDGEWWCPGRYTGMDPDGRDTHSGCDGDPSCDTCHGKPLSDALSGRVSLTNWWEREQNTYKGRVLRGWANLMASRYGRPVYLTGGALQEVSPRDIDVRVVLSRTEFEERFGKCHPHDHSGYALRFDQIDEERRWHVEVAKMNRQGANNTHLPIDFQVQPMREGLGYINERRVRLDDVPGLVAPWDA